jgi:capsular exopolysaccharide synthesis family protein
MNDTNEVKLHFLDYFRVVKNRLGLVLLTTFLVLITAGVTVFFLPKEYQSFVTLQVLPDSNKAIDVIGNAGSRGFDPLFVTTQFNIMRSTEILYPVVKALNLTREFAPPGQFIPETMAAAQLSRAIELQERRGTNLVDIRVYHQNPELARNMASQVADVYVDKRQQDARESFNKNMRQLNDEVERLRKEVEGLSSEVAKIRERDSIVDSDPESMAASLSYQDMELQNVVRSLSEQENRVAQLQSQNERVQQLKPEELGEAVRLIGIQEEDSVPRKIQLLEDAKAEEARLLSSGVGENHPRVRSLRAQMLVYQNSLSERLESIRRGLKSKLDIELSLLDKLTKSREEREKKSIEEKSKKNEYLDKKSRYVSAKRLLELAEGRKSSVQLDQNVTFTAAKVWSRAETPTAPARPNVPMIILISLVVGPVLGIALAFFVEYLDTSVKTVEDIQRHLAVPVLAVVPKGVSTLLRQRADSADAEVYRILKTNIEFNVSDREQNTYTLVSGGAGEGKSTTLNNLAFTFAKGGYRTLVVDADLRRASQHRFFDVDNDSGLCDYLTGKKSIEEITRSTKLDTLFFISSGKLPSDDVGILNSDRMSALIRQVKSQYDFVFFDSPPILGVSDASVLVNHLDITIMVVQHRRFPRSMLQRVKQMVEHVGGNVLGVVLNNMDTRHDDGYAYYGGYGGYYQAEESERTIGGRDGKPALPSTLPAKGHDY